MKKANVIFGTLCLLATVACSNVRTKDEHGTSHFDYEHQNEWTMDYGKMQSPINIVVGKTVPFDRSKESGEITVNYQSTISDIKDNGHSIEVIDGGNAKINGRAFELTQFHFHAESEHTINGKRYPLEAHFVNREQNGRLAVLAVFFEIGEGNDAFDRILQNVDNATDGVFLNPNELIPANKSYYHYLGSLTTPPLTENVEWYVFKTAVQVSEEQVEAFKTLYPDNHRDTQPLNNRIVVSVDN